MSDSTGGGEKEKERTEKRKKKKLQRWTSSSIVLDRHELKIESRGKGNVYVGKYVAKEM